VCCGADAVGGVFLGDSDEGVCAGDTLAGSGGPGVVVVVVVAAVVGEGKNV
jgi:hypothetical protein